MQVISWLVNDKDDNSDQIGAALSQPEIVVRHVLYWLKSRDLIKTVEFLNSTAPLQVFEVSTKLKRMLQSN